MSRRALTETFYCDSKPLSLSLCRCAALTLTVAPAKVTSSLGTTTTASSDASASSTPAAAATAIASPWSRSAWTCAPRCPQAATRPGVAAQGRRHREVRYDRHVQVRHCRAGLCQQQSCHVQIRKCLHCLLLWSYKVIRHYRIGVTAGYTVRMRKPTLLQV